MTATARWWSTAWTATCEECPDRHVSGPIARQSDAEDAARLHNAAYHPLSSGEIRSFRISETRIRIDGRDGEGMILHDGARIIDAAGETFALVCAVGLLFETDRSGRSYAIDRMIDPDLARMLRILRGDRMLESTAA